MSSVVLIPDEFRARYPQYSSLTDSQINDLFADASDYMANNSFIISDEAKLKRLLYLLSAHLASLSYTDGSGSGAAGGVGRIKTAEEEGVSISLDVGEMPFSRSWFAQSPFGFDFLQRIKPYLMGRVYYRNHGCWGILK